MIGPPSEGAIVDALHHVPSSRWGEVLEFVESLRTHVPAILTAADLARSDLVGLWGDRDDLDDPRDFARRLRDIATNRSRYEIILYWSDADSAFLAEIPELPGCMADGPTYQAALAAAEVVIAEWIETARELGRPIPEPKGRRIHA